MRLDDSTKLTPTDDHVVIKRLGAWPGLARESVLIVVEEKPAMECGRVEAVGPGYSYFGFDQSPERSPMDVSEGDIVMFNRYAGSDLGDDRVVLRHAEIYGIYTGELPETDGQS